MPIGDYKCCFGGLELDISRYEINISPLCFSSYSEECELNITAFYEIDGDTSDFFSRIDNVGNGGIIEIKTNTGEILYSGEVILVDVKINHDDLNYITANLSFIGGIRSVPAICDFVQNNNNVVSLKPVKKTFWELIDLD